MAIATRRRAKKARSVKLSLVERKHASLPPSKPRTPVSLKLVDKASPRIGSQLRRQRRLRGLRLKDVAEKAGLSESLISKIENNKVSPSISTLHSLAKALGTS